MDHVRRSQAFPGREISTQTDSASRRRRASVVVADADHEGIAARPGLGNDLELLAGARNRARAGGVRAGSARRVREPTPTITPVAPGDRALKLT